MQTYLITFRSVTYAQRGARLLESLGIRCRLRRTPRWLETRGCGYALELEQWQTAAQALEEQKIPRQKIYRLRGPEQAEEVHP